MALLLPAVVVVVIIAFDQPLSLPIGFEGVEIHISKRLTGTRPIASIKSSRCDAG